MYTRMIEFYGKRIKSYNIYIYMYIKKKMQKKRGTKKVHHIIVRCLQYYFSCYPFREMEFV